MKREGREKDKTNAGCTDEHARDQSLLEVYVLTRALGNNLNFISEFWKKRDFIKLNVSICIYLQIRMYMHPYICIYRGMKVCVYIFIKG